MRKITHTCDICERDLPIVDKASYTKDQSIYRVVENWWSGWNQRKEERWHEICGDCWKFMKDAARERLAQLQSGEESSS